MCHRLMLVLRSHSSLYNLHRSSGLGSYSFFKCLRRLILRGLVHRIYIVGDGYHYFLVGGSDRL